MDQMRLLFQTFFIFTEIWVVGFSLDQCKLQLSYSLLGSVKRNFKGFKPEGRRSLGLHQHLTNICSNGNDKNGVFSHELEAQPAELSNHQKSGYLPWLTQELYLKLWPEQIKISKFVIYFKDMFQKDWLEKKSKYVQTISGIAIFT